MFTKIATPIAMILIVLPLAACGAQTPTSSGTGNTGGNSQNAVSQTESVENYQMMPMMSGNVATIQLDASADGTTQQMKMGEVLAITLETNPSTGYSWVPTISNPAMMMQMVEPQYQAPTQGSTPVVGAPQMVTFYFQATGSGTTKLTMDYMRSFEQNVTPQKTITITVNVK